MTKLQETQANAIQPTRKSCLQLSSSLAYCAIHMMINKDKRSKKYRCSTHQQVLLAALQLPLLLCIHMMKNKGKQSKKYRCSTHQQILLAALQLPLQHRSVLRRLRLLLLVPHHLIITLAACVLFMRFVLASTHRAPSSSSSAKRVMNRASAG